MAIVLVLLRHMKDDRHSSTTRLKSAGSYSYPVSKQMSFGAPAPRWQTRGCGVLGATGFPCVMYERQGLKAMPQTETGELDACDRYCDWFIRTESMMSSWET